MRLRLLGPPRLEVDGTITDLPVDRPASLAYYLVGRGEWVRRAELAYLYNPDADETLALGNLRKLIHRLKQHAWAGALETDQTRVRLVLDSDVREFREHLEHKRFDQALGLYTGSFLEGVGFPDLAGYEAWLELERQDLAAAWRHAVLEQARHLETAREFADAERWLTRLWRVDPLDEDVVQALLRVLGTAGERSRALEVFERFRQDLKRELNAEPLPATRALLESASLQSHVFTTNQTHPKHNLPAPATRFVGRKDELERLHQMMPKHRLVTLLGLGGIGKTRLSLEVAWAQLEHFRDGVWFVPLAGVQSLDQFASTVAQAFGMDLSGANRPELQLQHLLRGKHMLLVLDNFEHLIEAALTLDELLEAIPELHALVTSRVALNLPAETLLDLGGLAFPPEDAADDLERFDAVALFLERASRVAPHFTITPHSLNAVSHIARRVEGLPLALELAASWSRSLTPSEIVQALERDMNVLRAQHPNVPERQRSVRAVLEYSWAQLSELEQRVLTGLTLFRGGFTLEAAQAVAGAHVPILLSLMNHALVRRSQEGRFDLHELVWQFASEQHQRHPEPERFSEAHLHYFLGLAQRANPNLNGAAQIEWKSRLRAEDANVTGALGWSFTHQPDTAVQLVAAMGRYWEATGLLSKKETWLTQAMSLDASAPVDVRAILALKYLASLIEQGAYTEAERWMPEAWHRCEATRDASLQAEWCNLAGLAATQQRHFDQAQPHLERGLCFAELVADQRTKNYLLLNLGHLASLRNDPETAFAYQQRSLELARQRQDTRLEMISLSNMAAQHLSAGAYPLSTQLSEQALPLAQQVNDQGFLVLIQGNLGYAKWQQGDHVEGERLYREHLLRLYEQNLMALFVENAFELAHFWQRLGFAEEAVCLWGATEQLRIAHQYPVFHGYEHLQTQVLNAVPGDQREALLAAGEGKSVSDLLRFIKQAARS